MQSFKEHLRGINESMKRIKLPPSNKRKTGKVNFKKPIAERIQKNELITDIEFREYENYLIDILDRKVNFRVGFDRLMKDIERNKIFSPKEIKLLREAEQIIANPPAIAGAIRNVVDSEQTKSARARDNLENEL